LQKLLMIIGAGILQSPVINIAKDMGLLTLVTDYNKDAYGLSFADYPVIMSTRDVDGSVRVAKEFSKRKRIDGVITVGTDASLTVAAVQHALDIPGNRIDVAEATTNKIKMRTRLRDHKIPEPEFFSCWSYDNVFDSSKTLGFPFVIKPADNMGARGVMRVDKPELLRFAYERAKNASPRGEVIAESYMEGPELSIDALVWENDIYITGVADRIIEFPPYFVETGHIMPTNLPLAKVEDGIDVFKRGISALGIEVGAAKGDIKLTSAGAMVGEIASRLSGGFMSAYTYPYSSGVNLIKAAINIALGNPPGDLTEKYQNISVERAIIPGSGIVNRIEGIEEALSIKGVKNIFVTCNIGDNIHIPTSNVEKCGNVIAVADTRDQALHLANLGVKMVNIVLGNKKELNDGLIRKNAMLKLKGVCSVCRSCDGIECSGKIPGIGSKSNGGGFRRNILALKSYSILPNVLKNMDNINTGTDCFGIPLDIPVLPSPISNVKRNLNGVFKEDEYNSMLLKGAKKSGTIGCIAQKEYGPDGDNIDYMLNPLNDVYGHGIPFFNPYYGEATTLQNIKECFRKGIKTCGLSLDLKDGHSAILINKIRLKDIIKNSPVPIIVKGILSKDNAIDVIEAGAKAIVISNRGGRLLESAPSFVDVIKDIKNALANRALIIADGGIRTGEDIFKGLALGADLVFIGRPILIHIAGGKDDGVNFYFNNLKCELKNTMLMAGAQTISDITPALIRKI